MRPAVSVAREPESDRGDNATSALDQVMRQQAERDAWNAVVPAPKRDPAPIVMAVTLLLCGYAWVANPSWLRPDVAPPPTRAERSAGARLGLYLTAQRVEVFRSAHHRLPTRLAQAGQAAMGVVYQRLDDTRYQLATELDGAPLVLQSTDDMASFVGDAAAVLHIEKGARP